MTDLGKAKGASILQFDARIDNRLAKKSANRAGALDVSSYFDQATFEREMALFRHGPGYLGHQLMVPELGDYQALPADREGRLLVRNTDGIQCLSNVCRHRQALMLKGRGNTEQIVCPLHRWTYRLDGQLLGAPHFEQQPCLHLEQFKLQEWKGLLFEGPRPIARDLANMKTASEFDFSGYRFDHVEVHECAYNWKTFIEVYLEDYHVAPFHPGLAKFVSCDDLQWEFDDQFSVQIVGVNRGLQQPGTPVYKRWHEQVLNYRNGQVPKHGAIWLTYYPNVMVEWYPHVLVVSTLIPRGPRQTTNVIEFYYPEDIALFEREFVEAERAAYMETCVEDDEIALRMDSGRERLLERGVNDQGPYQHPMETGMKHFHDWYRRQMTSEDEGC